MKNAESKLDVVRSDISEIKSSISKLEVHTEVNSKLLDRLTESVEHHIKRTDLLEIYVKDLETEQKLNKQTLDHEVSKVKLVIGVLVAVGGIVSWLSSIGIFQKLLKIFLTE